MMPTSRIGPHWNIEEILQSDLTESMNSRWTVDEQNRFGSTIERADLVTVIVQVRQTRLHQLRMLPQETISMIYNYLMLLALSQFDMSPEKMVSTLKTSFLALLQQNWQITQPSACDMNSRKCMGFLNSAQESVKNDPAKPGGGHLRKAGTG